MRGDVVAARTNYKDQLSIGERIKEDKQRAYALQGLGEVYFESDDKELARKSLDQALTLRDASNETDLALETKISLERLSGDYAGARATAEQFRIRERPDEQAEAEVVAVESALEAKPLNLQVAQTSAAVLKRLLPMTEDQSLQLSIRTACAKYDAAFGSRQLAINELRSVIETASEHGYRVTDLEAELALAGLAKSLQERTRILNETERTARALGLQRIAREAASRDNQDLLVKVASPH